MQTFQQITNEILEEFAVEFIQNRIEAARDAKLKASGELLRSFDADVINTAIKDVSSMLLAFEEHGRFLDMKRLRRFQQMPVDAIKEWVEAIGVEKFQKGRFVRARKGLNRQKLINAIAWGVAKKKRRKRRKWYAKSRETDIQKLYRRLLDAYADFTLQNMKDGFKKG